VSNPRLAFAARHAAAGYTGEVQTVALERNELADLADGALKKGWIG
jgi:hypothetical protein